MISLDDIVPALGRKPLTEIDRGAAIFDTPRQNGDITMFKRILVAVDGTSTSNRGLVAAIALAKEQGATLHVLHVIDDMAIVPMFDTAGYVPGYFDSMVASLRESGRKILSRAQTLAAKRGVNAQQKMLETRGQGVANAILQHCGPQ